VQANPQVGYPHQWLADRLNIPIALLEETLAKCKEQERISENSVGIKILKFAYYQDELGKGEEKENEKGDGIERPPLPEKYRQGK
jgi:cytochrome c